MSDITARRALPGADLREARNEDLPQVQAIYADHVERGTASFEETPPDLAEITRRRDALTAAGYPFLVAAEGARVLAYGYLGAYRPRPAYRNTVEDSIYVLPGHEGRGLGGLLLKRLIEIATEADFRQMVAVIGDSANTASIALHRRFGFAHVGTLTSVGFKHGRWLDAVIMQLALGPGNQAGPTR